MAGTIPLRGLGVGLDEDRRVRVLGPRAGQHRAEGGGPAPLARTEASSRVWSITSTWPGPGAGQAGSTPEYLVRCPSRSRAMASRARASSAVSSSGCCARMSSRSHGRSASKCTPCRSMSSPSGAAPLRPGRTERRNASSTCSSPAPVRAATAIPRAATGRRPQTATRSAAPGQPRRSGWPESCRMRRTRACHRNPPLT